MRATRMLIAKTLSLGFFFYWLNVFGMPCLAFANGCENRVGSEAQRVELLSITETAMRTAGKSILELRSSKSFQIQQKESFADIKTTGDCSSQEIILNALAENKATKNARFIAEEKCEQTRNLLNEQSTSNAVWVLDPIDGTTNYAHGMPHFSISLALVVNGIPCFGAVYAPVYHEFYYAYANQGAFIKQQTDSLPSKLAVSKISDLNQSLWITGTEGGPKKAAIEKNKKTFNIALELLQQTHDLRRTGSASLDLSSIASGKAEGYFELSEGLNWWDIAAGILLVKEAGGEVFVKESKNSTQNGIDRMKRPIEFILATNGQPRIHKAFKKLLMRKSIRLNLPPQD
jgi:myo-inositol-1(or 4)-monophosphatase